MNIPEFSRRGALWLSFIGALSPVSVWAQNNTDSADDVGTAGAVPDLVLGESSAPVTIVEYHSLTCPHCGDFHRKTLPFLKRKYVETGAVRIIFRDFPLDNIAFGAAMLARCADGNKILAVYDFLYARQEDWIRAKSPWDRVQELLIGAAGYSKKEIDACLQRKDLFEGMRAEYLRAAETFEVQSTPSFFINGKPVKGAFSPAEFEAAIDPLVPAVRVESNPEEVLKNSE